MNRKVTFIIQARLSSTRLPNKVILPFWNGKTILNLLIEKLKKFHDCRIILATSELPANIQLVDVAQKANIGYFQGSENDVLQRFIDAAESQDAEHIIRICADNPFLDVDAIEELLTEIRTNDNYDYISFLVNGSPSIKTHFGFWAEYVTLSALKKICANTSESLYHEHVTNYIYTHPEQFNIKWLSPATCVANRHDIRLTIDTTNDFCNAQAIYTTLAQKESFSINTIIEYIDQHPECAAIMKNEILTNTK